MDIIKPPGFAALSYVWGDPTQLVPLACDGQMIDITINLRDALRENRHWRKTRTLWVDAVCIDQANVHERNHQVKMMVNIYRAAYEVIIWLGYPEQKDEQYDAMNAITLMFLQIQKGLKQGNNMSTILELDEVGITVEEFQPPMRLFRSSWFQRTWVIQEAGVARRAFACYGNTHTNWNCIGIVAMYLFRYKKPFLERMDAMDDVYRVMQLYLMFLPLQRPTSFVEVLNEARPYLASDPRDKIYALLGHPMANCVRGYKPSGGPVDDDFENYRELAANLAPDPTYSRGGSWELLGRGTARFKSNDPVVIVDYHKPTVEVYRDFALALIERDSNLESLAAVQHAPTLDLDKDELPSWVPRWDCYSGARMLGYYSSNQLAGLGSSPYFTPSEDKNVLIVRAIFFDKAGLCTKVLERNLFTLHPVHKGNPILALWRVCGCDESDAVGGYPFLPVWPHSHRDKRVAYRMAWTAGKDLSELDGYNSEADFYAYLVHLVEQYVKDHGIVMNDAMQQDVDRLRELGATGVAERYQAAAAEVCHQRRFFVTKAGFFGIGPAAMRSEDEIVVLMGTGAAFVVRRDGDHHCNLIGECYVDGLMRGQAVQAWKQGLLVAADVQLR